jgi:hypothetical protein
VARLYRQARADPELLSAVNTVALLQARCLQLMGRLATPETGTLWRDVEGAVAGMQAANGAGDQAGVVAGLEKLLRLVAERRKDEETWKELRAVEQEKLVAQAKEWSRMKELRQLATAEEVLGLVRAIAESVSRHVSNPQERLAVVNDIVRYTNADEPKKALGQSESLPSPE